MSKLTSILALIPVLSMLAACGGPSPTGPGEMNVSSSDSGAVTAMSRSNAPCSPIGIDLQVVDSSRTMLWVEATYQFEGPPPPEGRQPGDTSCPAPAWFSSRMDMVVNEANPFQAGFPLTATGVARLTAVAPNGVRNTIRLDLGDGGSS